MMTLHRRAKEKRLKKDAGRARWGQYFRCLKGPLSPGREKRAGTDSDRDSELELDYAQCEYCYTLSVLLTPPRTDLIIAGLVSVTKHPAFYSLVKPLHKLHY